MKSSSIQRLERARPEEAGMASEGILDFLQLIQERNISLHSFMLLRHGKVIAEASYAPFKREDKHPIFSVSKSITSALIGIAIGEELLSLEDKVVDFFPEKLQGEAHPYTSIMTVKDLLTMSTVHPRSTDTSGEDWVASFLNTPPGRPPGSHFAYDTTGTHTLCAILEKVTGTDLYSYARTKLFDPIGIGPLEWESCPMGIRKGGSGIRCTTEDMARFGQLYLQQGLWNGQQVLPAGWVELSTSKQVENFATKIPLEGGVGYGFQFWRTRNNAYCAFGMGGQFVLVLPEKDTVFVTTANTLQYKDSHQQVLDAFWEAIYPSISSGETPMSDTAVYDELLSKMERLSVTMPQGCEDSNIGSAISGKRYQLEPNRLGLESCVFLFQGDESQLQFYRGEEEILGIPFRGKGWSEGTDPFYGKSSAGSAVWVDSSTLLLRIELFDVLQMYSIVCRMDGERIVMQLVPAGADSTVDIECYLTGTC